MDKEDVAILATNIRVVEQKRKKASRRASQKTTGSKTC